MPSKKPKQPSTALAIPTEVTQTVALAHKYAAQCLRQVQQIEVNSPAVYAKAGGILVEAKSRLKVLDAQEKSVTRPITAGLKAFRALLAEPKEILQKIIDTIDVKQAGFRRVQEEHADAARRAAEEEAEKENKKILRAAERRAERQEAAGHEAEAEATRALAQVYLVEAAPIATFSPPQVEGLQTRTYWDFEISNEALIPREFLTPDLIKIGAEVRDKKKEDCIPGVRAFSYEKSALAPPTA